MGSSPPQADIFLERDSTRVRGNLVVTTANAPQAETIQLDPLNSNITVRRRASEDSPAISVQRGDGTRLANLTHRETQTDDWGELRVAAAASDEKVVVESERAWGTLRILEGSSTRTEVTTHIEREFPVGGEITVGAAPVGSGVVLKAEAGDNPEVVSGLLEVYDRDGRSTGRLIGSDAALELLDTVEGGGEALVLGAPPPDTEAPPDVFVDLNRQGALSSDSEPRIKVDGQGSTVTLGRRELDNARRGVDGQIHLRDDLGGNAEALLSAGVNRSSRRAQFGEVVLRRKGSSGLETRGVLRSVADGLMIDTGPLGTPQSVGPTAKFTAGGDVLIAGSVNQGLATADPRFVVGAVVVSQGETGELEVAVGDADTLRFKLGDSSLNYVLEATLSGYTDGRLWLGVDTAAAGTSTDTVRILAGDASLTIDSESSSPTPLPAKDYPIKIKEQGASNWSDVGTLTVQ